MALCIEKRDAKQLCLRLSQLEPRADCKLKLHGSCAGQFHTKTTWLYVEGALAPTGRDYTQNRCSSCPHMLQDKPSTKKILQEPLAPIYTLHGIWPLIIGLLGSLSNKKQHVRCCFPRTTIMGKKLRTHFPLLPSATIHPTSTFPQSLSIPISRQPLSNWNWTSFK